jgi:hypothetical protein
MFALLRRTGVRHKKSRKGLLIYEELAQAGNAIIADGAQHSMRINGLGARGRKQLWVAPAFVLPAV